MACIYKITNIINNKVYIGQTIYDTCAHRWKYYKNIIGKSYAPKIAIVHALNKYGYENFKFECIESGLEINQLDEREQYWIKYYCPILSMRPFRYRRRRPWAVPLSPRKKNRAQIH